jgi:hypothetical protein
VAINFWLLAVGAGLGFALVIERQCPEYCPSLVRSSSNIRKNKLNSSHVLNRDYASHFILGKLFPK